MKITTFSDYHNADALPELEPADLLIFAGDITDAEPDNFKDQKDQVIKFFNDLARQQDKFEKIIIVFGNHDVWTEKFENRLKIEEIIKNDFYTETVILDDTFTEFRGKWIYGNPNSRPMTLDPVRNRWAYSWTGNKLNMMKQNITRHLQNNGKIDIVVSHAPIKGINGWVDGRDAGSKKIHGYLESKQALPQLWVSGHIHESYGKKTIGHQYGKGETIYLNSAISHADIDFINGFMYRQINLPITVEIED